MSTYLLDSSALTKAYVQETGTAWVLNLLDPAGNHVLFVSRLAGVEVTSALVRKVPALTSQQLQSALGDLRDDLQNHFTVVEITEPLCAQAMAVAEKHRLRGYDAVQLATMLSVVAQQGGLGLSSVCLVSADVSLNLAAQAEGLQVDDPNSHP